MDNDVLAYLLDSDPAIRWQVLRDVIDAPASEVATERTRVATEGWGARLLGAQADDGRWDGGTYQPGWTDQKRPFFDAWTATHPSLELLRVFGADPDSTEVQHAIARVHEHVLWEYDDLPYFDGETEPCINGGALANAAYFKQGGAPIVQTILRGQLADGGWNCWDNDGTSASSFHSTICVLEGLFAWEQATAGSEATATARRRGEEYLLERQLLLRRSTGAIVDPRFAMASFPTRWYYDVVRALDYFRVARPERDSRCAHAVELVRGARLPNGMWKLENTHQGPTLFDLEGEHEGFPSRWVTLHALRVLKWWDASTGGKPNKG